MMYKKSEKYILGTHSITNAKVSNLTVSNIKELYASPIDNKLLSSQTLPSTAEDYLIHLISDSSIKDLFLIFINFLKKKTINSFTIIEGRFYLNFVISTILISNLFYLFFLIKDFDLSSFHTTFLIFSLAFLPISLIVILKNKVKSNNLGEATKKEHVNKVGVISDKVVDEVCDVLIFKSLNKTDEELILNKKDFLFVEAIKNNVHIYYYEDELIKTRSIRNTLKNVENQIQKEAIFRCHRSFIVNTNNIETAKGNSNSYKIYFNKYNHYIPVSRNYTKLFKEFIK